MKTLLVHLIAPQAAAVADGKLDPRKIVNRLNYINFIGGKIILVFRHRLYGRQVRMEGVPLPAQQGSQVEICWANGKGLPERLSHYEFDHLLIPTHNHYLAFRPQIVRLDENGICFELPTEVCEVGTRHLPRFQGAPDIDVEFIQNGVVFCGRLVDFNSKAFCLQLEAVPPQTFQWINPSCEGVLLIRKGDQTLYSGICTIYKQRGGQQSRIIVAEPVPSSTPRFQNKAFRSLRQTLVPAPQVYFVHPLTDIKTRLTICQISGSGFSIVDSYGTSGLFLGLMLNVTISFAGQFELSCKVQVVSKSPQEGNLYSWGLAILDMDMQEHLRLLSVVYQNRDQLSSVCGRVDMDSLWEFFFETGFIYPQKYSFLEGSKQTLKDVYEKLYTQTPSIARHFIYQDQGVIWGHMSMLRFYRNSWMVHHHAADRTRTSKAGIMVLGQACRYTNDVYNLYSAHMAFVYCFFRPENKFPMRVFGGAASFINDREACSLDDFAYLHSIPGAKWDEGQEAPKLEEGWVLEEAQDDDLLELAGFYEQKSGGLMCRAFDLEPGTPADLELATEYARLGLARKRKLYALRHSGLLKAFFMINFSDLGLNLSDLTNCVTAIVMDRNDLPAELFNKVLRYFLGLFPEAGSPPPVLLYPQDAAVELGLRVEKTYTLWVLNVQQLDSFFRYCEKKFRGF